MDTSNKLSSRNEYLRIGTEDICNFSERVCGRNAEPKKLFYGYQDKKTADSFKFPLFPTSYNNTLNIETEEAYMNDIDGTSAVLKSIE